MYVIEWPFDLLRRITLPPAEKSKYDKTWAAISIFPGLIFMFFVST